MTVIDPPEQEEAPPSYSDLFANTDNPSPTPQAAPRSTYQGGVWNANLQVYGDGQPPVAVDKKARNDTEESHQTSYSHPGPSQTPFPPQQLSPFDPRLVNRGWNPTISSSQAKSAIKDYGSPLAGSPDWSPTEADAALTRLPTLDFQLRIKQRFARFPADPFKPPAISFSRPPSQNASYAPFETFYTPSSGSGKFIGDGFKSIYPGKILVTHDVSCADWERFMEDIYVAGRLNPGQLLTAGFAPLGLTGLPIHPITKAIQNGMKKRKEPAAASVIEHWQENFFETRKLDVFVLTMAGRITGRKVGGVPLGDVPLNLTQMQQAHAISDSDSGSTSSTSDSDDDSDDDSDLEYENEIMESRTAARRTRREMRKHSRMQRREQRRLERRTRRFQRRQERRQYKANGKAKVDRSMRLILVVAPLV